MAEGFEPSHGRINSAVPYQLGYATTWIFGLSLRSLIESPRRRSNAARFLRQRSKSKDRFSGGDEGSRTLIVRFTRPTLCYPVELHRRSDQTSVCESSNQAAQSSVCDSSPEWHRLQSVIRRTERPTYQPDHRLKSVPLIWWS